MIPQHIKMKLLKTRSVRQNAGGSTPQPTALVTKIQGQAWVCDHTGDDRRLEVGSKIYVPCAISTGGPKGDMPEVTLKFNTGMELFLGGGALLLT